MRRTFLRADSTRTRERELGGRGGAEADSRCREGNHVGQGHSAMEVRAGIEAASNYLDISRPLSSRPSQQEAGEGPYRENVARFNGDSQARTMNMQADALRYQGATALADAAGLPLRDSAAWLSAN